MASLLARERQLTRALADPDRSPEAREGLLQTVLGGQVGATELELLRGMVRSRWSRQRDLVDAVEELSAQAAFTVAEQDGVLDDVEDELFRFSRLVDREPALRAALTDSALPVDRRTGLLHALLNGKVQPVTGRLIEALVVEPRGRSLDDGLAELTRLAAARRQRLVASVRVAAPLTDEQAQVLSEALGRVYGRRVHLQVEVDPWILGGATVTVGDEVFDGSVARRLSDVRRRLSR